MSATPDRRASRASRPAASPPSRPSRLEQLFELHLKARNVTGYVREHRFDPSRRWRLDFAWPVHKLAVEIQGGIFTRGRHTRGAALAREYEKLNAAQLLGWTVLLVTGAQVESGDAADVVARTLRVRENAQNSMRGISK
jgi:very-short-patch-repair endonuclease